MYSTKTEIDVALDAFGHSFPDFYDSLDAELELLPIPKLSVRTPIDKIMTNRPTTTTKDSSTPIQPNTAAANPTCPLTVPYDKLSVMVAAAELAMCCQKTDTNIKMELRLIIAKAACDTRLDGKGFTSRSLPSPSVSSCQPGKVARRIIVMSVSGTPVNLKLS